MSQTKTLFGVPIPDGAVKATVKPALGRGQSKAMWQGSIERDGCHVDECDIISEVAENAGFWSYLDLQIQAKRVNPPKDGAWPFKVLVSFEDQAGIKTDAVTSTEEVEFFRRSGASAASQSEQAFNRLLGMLEKLHAETMEHHEKMASAALKTIEETGKQSAAIIQASATPMQALVEANNKAFQQERDRYDSSIKLNMRMLEKRTETNVFDDVAKLAPLAPFLKPVVDKLLN